MPVELVWWPEESIGLSVIASELPVIPPPYLWTTTLTASDRSRVYRSVYLSRNEHARIGGRRQLPRRLSPMWRCTLPALRPHLYTDHYPHSIAD